MQSDPYSTQSRLFTGHIVHKQSIQLSTVRGITVSFGLRPPEVQCRLCRSQQKAEYLQLLRLGLNCQRLLMLNGEELGPQCDRHRPLQCTLVGWDRGHLKSMLVACPPQLVNTAGGVWTQSLLLPRCPHCGALEMRPIVFAVF